MSHRNPLFILHIAVLTVGVVSFLATSLAALFYLIEHRQLKLKRFGKFFDFLPALEKLDRFSIQTLIFGFIFLTFGMISGIYLAHEAWRMGWQTNPKFIWAMVTWGWYALLLVIRYRVGWRGGRFFTLSVIGFSLLLVTFVGVSFLSTS